MLEKLYAWQKNMNQMAQEAIKESNKDDDVDEESRKLHVEIAELKKVNLELNEKV
jgi:hypothetical protein